MEKTKTSAPQVHKADAEHEAYQARIEQLEKKLEKIGEQKTQTSTVSVSVSDMNEIYSNHLDTIDLILGVTAFVILVVGGFFGWVGYNNIKNMVQNKIDEVVKKVTEKIIKDEIAPLRDEYKKIVEEQKKQDIRIQVEQHRSQAYNYYSKKQYKEAIEEFTKAINLDSDGYILYADRGHTNNMLKQHDAALADYEKVVNLNSDVVEGYLGRGSTKMALGQYESALEDYKKVITLNPNIAGGYAGMGAVKAFLGQHKAALVDLNKAIALDPDNSVSHFNRACAYSMTKKSSEQVLEELAIAIRLDDENMARARTDKDFEFLQDNSEFRKLVGLDEEK